MHTVVTHMNTVIMLDHTNTGPSAIKLLNGRCRNQPAERISKVDCYAHSIMFNPGNNQVRPLYVYTDTWCSSGQFFNNGRMVQTGGDFEGNRKIRTLQPCGAGDHCRRTQHAFLRVLSQEESRRRLLQLGYAGRR
ncbi:aldehyde oxidase GLOX isoform X2 [Physcomitrium patens]|uniref:aldehyde oxidase GLOX n=1 Tax=Physcomitrium patens TaxID=3218 RepID=UPI003CCE118D